MGLSVLSEVFSAPHICSSYNNCFVISVVILLPTNLKMKNFLAILAVFAVFVTISEAGYNCNNWKKMDGPCPGCVFTSGDMAGKCKRTGQYFDQGACKKAGGTWCG